MKFYTKQYDFYRGIDLHARCLNVCILNQAGDIVLHKKVIPPSLTGTAPSPSLKLTGRSENDQAHAPMNRLAQG